MADDAHPEPGSVESLPSDTREISSLGKTKGPQRLLRGVSRISSSQSLIQLGRSRATTAPVGYRPSLSCISLISPTTPTTPSSSHACGSTPSSPDAYSTAPSSRPTSPSPGASSADGIQNIVGIRKLVREDLTDSTRIHAASNTIALPPDRIANGRRARAPVLTWATVPGEIKVHILSFLLPKELVRVSRVSTEFHRLCFDGQLWSRLDASGFYNEIPPDSLTRLIETTGPFIKDLNLRGCIQIEPPFRAEAIVAACTHLVNATLEGCQTLQKGALHTLLRSNERLTNINLTGLRCATNTACYAIGDCCPQLQVLNVSWCKKIDTTGLLACVQGCTQLRDLRAGEVCGFAEDSRLARTIFKTNRLERLVLCGCDDFSDTSLRIILYGTDQPEMDFMTDRPRAPPRKLRHLDLSRCPHISNLGIRSLAHFVPDLEGLQLNRCTAVGDEGLAPLVATTPRLTHLELDDLAAITNSFLSDHLATAPCAPTLSHLSVGYCENLGDAGMVPIMDNCKSLSSVVMDNTRVSNLVLASAVQTVQKRSPKSFRWGQAPRIGLRMDVYDCQNITWAGVVGVLCHNADLVSTTPSSGLEPRPCYPVEAIALKCFYGWQMTVDEHMKRVQRCDFSAASRLCKKWTEYMQATEEAGVSGTGLRRRRRRAREAQQVHADEQGGTGRRRARTLGSCIVM